MVDGMSISDAALVFGLHRDTMHKMLAHSVRNQPLFESLFVRGSKEAPLVGRSLPCVAP